MKKLIITDASATQLRPVESMHTLRFSRVVKRTVKGMGLTIQIMMEARVSTRYDAGTAVLDCFENDQGDLKMTLHPMPEPVMILGASTTQIEMAMPATETEVVDLAGMVIKEIEAAEERAVEILAPTVAPKQSARTRLLSGSQMKHGLPDPLPAEPVILPEAQ